MRLADLILLAWLGATASQASGGLPPVTETANSGGFKLVFDHHAAALCVDSNDFTVVEIAATNFAADVERVTGRQPKVLASPAAGSPVVFIGTLGHSRMIDQLAQAGTIKVDAIRSQWESFLLTTVTNPLPGVKSGLVVAGSDRRGTAFGVFSLSEAIGVSPWYWWADVPPQTHHQLVIPAGTYTQGPPAVKYRGIFINDEDWGMKPWAAKTLEPEVHDIGPRTYARICELLLRLQANYLWPAMHPCSRAFNTFPENKIVADDYAIVMGSSHCEPMLRNNVGEWPKNQAARWNYQTNAAAVKSYWEERVKENGRYENVYTLGMRGVHDDPLRATGTPQEKVALVEKIFADQRELLARWVKPDVTQVPQAFVPYKEVLQIYRDGLRVPDDVILVWVDDNHGYIRELPTPAEQARRGGSGVYYHVSYWGAPENYLWLCSTPPALIGEEMGKALDYKARALWMLNVGDLKPAEIDIDYFLRLAREGQVVSQPEFLQQWAERTFGREPSREIAEVMGEYYWLNDAVKPEHLLSAKFSEAEAAQRLQRFAALADKADGIWAKLPKKFQDAFYELVIYPVRCSALANEKVLCAEQSRRLAVSHDRLSNAYADRAEKAHARINEETDFYNTKLAGGKWRYMMYDAPCSLKLARLPDVARVTNAAPLVARSGARLPSGGSPSDPVRRHFVAPTRSSFAEADGCISMAAAHYTRNLERGAAAWRVVEGLGRTGQALTVFPATTPSVTNLDDLAASAPCLEYDFQSVSTGAATVTVYCVPVHRLDPGRGAHFAVAVDDATPQLVDIESEEYSKTWAANVLRAAALGVSTHHLAAAGAHTLKLWMVDPGVPVDKIVVDFGGLKPSFFGPEETRADAVSLQLDLSRLRNPVWVSRDNLRDPAVLKTDDGYHLFYSRFSSLTGGWGDPQHWHIAEAWTKDFLTFTNDRDVSPAGCASPGDVVKWHGRWLLPYQTYPGKPTQLVFAESTNLETWSQPRPFLTAALTLPWNGLHRVIDPSLVVDGDTLHCFFIGSANHTNRAGKVIRANLMGHAVTQDPELAEWKMLTPDAPLIGYSEQAPDGVENTMVFRTGDHWTMIYSEGLEAQHLAGAITSDLANWQLQGPIEIPRQHWMVRKYGAPYVWRDGDRWLMVLMGADGQDRTSLGLLTSTDGLRWQLLPESSILPGPTP